MPGPKNIACICRVVRMGNLGDSELHKVTAGLLSWGAVVRGPEFGSLPSCKAAHAPELRWIAKGRGVAVPVVAEQGGHRGAGAGLDRVYLLLAVPPDGVRGVGHDGVGVALVDGIGVHAGAGVQHVVGDHLEYRGTLLDVPKGHIECRDRRPRYWCPGRGRQRTPGEQILGK